MGDAFGQCFFASDGELARLLDHEIEPSPPWPYTDDTLMGASVYAVLARSGHVDQDALAASFAAGYDFHRGYGPCMHRLLMAFQQGGDWRTLAPAQFGGMGSHGNGAAMRAAPVGAFFADDLSRVVAEAEKSATVTHTHPEGVAGAVAVAVAAALAWRAGRGGPPPTPAGFLEAVAAHVAPGAVRAGIELAAGLPEGASVRLAVAALGNGVGLSAADTVPFALWAAATHLHDYRAALWRTASGLGDRDTTCAIAGGVVALAAGAVPAEWRAAREPLPARLIASPAVA